MPKYCSSVDGVLYFYQWAQKNKSEGHRQKKERVLVAYLPAYSYIESLRKIINFIKGKCYFYILKEDHYESILVTMIYFNYLTKESFFSKRFISFRFLIINKDY